MRVALISDAHFGPPAYYAGKLRKLTHRAEELTRRFVRRMNEVERPELVVNLGDVIEDESRERDLEAYSRFIDVLSGLEARVVHVAGNHDQVHLGDDDLRRLWKHEGELFYSFDQGDFHFVVLRTVEIRDTAVHLPSEQLLFVEADLAKTTRPTVVLMHHPASEQVLAGNRWFERAPHLCRVAERRALRSVIERSGKVVAVFNGHVHWNHLDVVRGIPYVTVQSLIENLDDDAPGRPAAAYAVCDLETHRLTITVHGEETVRYQIES
ncbi:MAG TPA: metallophosphoesterase [Polyangiaceae bacterium]|nr:MAG: phosphoesterase [Pseudomonadota bacterium]HLV21014.1 metallophosphoesterase [Polyangiaceae bacterium]